MIINLELNPHESPERYIPEVHFYEVDAKVFYAWVPEILGSGKWGSTRKLAMNAAYGFWHSAYEGLN